jgi:Mn2+/Fe2+ NRAMP family transporter
LQAAQALSPLGELGPILFAIGIVGAGSVALPVLVASMCYGFSEAMGWKSGLSEHPWEAKRFYVLISAAVFIAAAVNFFKINPVAMLYWSQILAGVLTVPILIFILLLSNDRRVMRTTNTRWQNFWLGAAIGGLVSAGALVLWWKLIG